jgi:hypothetical protein
MVKNGMILPAKIPAMRHCTIGWRMEGVCKLASLLCVILSHNSGLRIPDGRVCSIFLLSLRSMSD